MLASHIAYNRMAGQGFGAIYNMKVSEAMAEQYPINTLWHLKTGGQIFHGRFCQRNKRWSVIIGTISPGWY